LFSGGKSILLYLNDVGLRWHDLTVLPQSAVSRLINPNLTVYRSGMQVMAVNTGWSALA
jgi:hypothetical protein